MQMCTRVYIEFFEGDQLMAQRNTTDVSEALKSDVHSYFYPALISIKQGHMMPLIC